MPTYTFRCTSCGPFAVTRSMNDQPRTPSCPVCTAPARRVFSSTALTTFTAAEHRAIDAAAASAENPMVVKSIPASVGRLRAPRRNPRLPGLPRW
ncbi:putative regulatory protein, FmdB family [Mycolicibacterium phlei]|jgi:putative FmdB family regulatory protein|uniref:FmdB family zinc ribbon protein n=2 Tax=Mycolicibacterium phlei TaxID=1771 RepID=UPI00078CA788|nr:Zinc ribbon domain protein [Mycolicibacterium phlei]STZ16835.1 putative regulatory protein, FmdB family [Mycolicibacterium phlei]VEG08385.1 putative regulatory protein, FmdB family [Mycobacteroides chelonae]